jgi:hypothetical protein
MNENLSLNINQIYTAPRGEKNAQRRKIKTKNFVFR